MLHAESALVGLPLIRIETNLGGERPAPVDHHTLPGHPSGGARRGGGWKMTCAPGTEVGPAVSGSISLQFPSMRRGTSFRVGAPR